MDDSFTVKANGKIELVLDSSAIDKEADKKIDEIKKTVKSKLDKATKDMKAQIDVGINIDNYKLAESALDGIKKDVEETKEEYKKCQEEFDSFDQTAIQSAFEQITKYMDEASAAIDKFKSKANDLEDYYEYDDSGVVDGVAEAYDRLNDKIKEAKDNLKTGDVTSLETLKKEIIDCEQHLKDLGVSSKEIFAQTGSNNVRGQLTSQINKLLKQSVSQNVETSALDDLVNTIRTRMQEIREAMSSGTASSLDAQNYQTELKSLSQQLIDAGGSAEQAKLDFESLNHELVTYSQQKYQSEVADTLDISSNAEKAAQSANDEATAREKAAAATERQASALDKIVTRYDADDNLTSRSDTESQKTSKVKVKTVTNYTMNEETKQLEVSSKTVEENFAAANKESEKLATNVSRAKSNLSQFNERTAGRFSNSDAYKNVQKAITSLEDGKGTVDDVNVAMAKLNQYASEFAVQIGNEKLNKWRSLANETDNMTSSIENAQTAYDALLVKPEELGIKLIELKDKNTELQKVTDKSTSAWAQSFNELKTGVAEVNAEISNYQKSNGSIFDLSALESSSLKYFQSIIGSAEEAQGAIDRIANENNWSNVKVFDISKDAAGNVKELTVQYEDATGAVEQFVMAQAKIATIDIDGNKKVGTGLVQSGGTKVIKTASQAYAEQIEQERKEADAAYEQMYKELIDWNSKISSSIASFEGASQKQKNSLSAYTGLNSDSLNEARQYEKEYRLILNDLKTAYNSETGVIDTDMLKAMGWDDTQIANVEQELSNLAASFSATMSQVKREAQGLDFSKIFSDLNTGTFSKQIESLKQQMNNIVDPEERETIAALISELERLQQEMQDSKQTGKMTSFVDSYNQFNEVLKATSNELNTYKSNMGEAEASAKKMAQTVESVAKLLDNGTYSSTSESLTSQLTMFDGFSSTKISQLRQYAQEYKDLYNKLKDSYNTETGQFLISDEEVVSTKQKLDDLKTSYSNLLKEIKADAGTSNISKMLNDVNAGKYISQVDQLREKINSLGSNVDTSGLQSIQNELEAIAAEMFQAASDGNFDGVTKSVQEFNAKLKEANASLTDLGLSGGGGGGSWINTLFNQLSSGFSQISKIVGTGFITRELRSAASEMVSTVEEIDSAMAQLQIVTGATDSEMTEFLEGSIELAKELGQDVTDVLSTIETYSRLGYGLEDASVLAEYSSILSNVAGVDIEDASSGLTSVIKGFDLSTQDAEHVADTLIEVGQNYAVSASEILEAFEKSSAALAATGSTFEESAAIIAAGEQYCLENMETYFQRTHLNALIA